MSPTLAKVVHLIQKITGRFAGEARVISIPSSAPLIAMADHTGRDSSV
jgi:hypothetical protein